MKKTLFILGAIASLILVMVLLAIIFRHQLADQIRESLNNASRLAFGFDINEQDAETCVKLTNAKAKDLCFNVVANNTNTPDFCGNIMDEYQRDICYLGFANKNLDSSLCQYIGNAVQRNNCVSFIEGSNKRELPSDFKWLDYSNDRLGIAFKYPNFVSVYCDKFGLDDYYRHVPSQIFVEGEDLYVKSQLSYQSQDGICHESAQTADSLRTYEKDGNILPWHIIVRKIKNEGEINSFIKEKFGSSCSFDSKAPTEHSGIYDVRVKGDGRGYDDTNCFFGAMREYFKYNSNNNFLYYWNTGQDCSVYYQGNYAYHCFDEEMVSSVKFID